MHYFVSLTTRMRNQLKPDVENRFCEMLQSTLHVTHKNVTP